MFHVKHLSKNSAVVKLSANESLLSNYSLITYNPFFSMAPPFAFYQLDNLVARLVLTVYTDQIRKLIKEV
jgi:hypothetical protein